MTATELDMARALVGAGLAHWGTDPAAPDDDVLYDDDGVELYRVRVQLVTLTPEQ